MPKANTVTWLLKRDKEDKEYFHVYSVRIGFGGKRVVMFLFSLYDEQLAGFLDCELEDEMYVEVTARITE